MQLLNTATHRLAEFHSDPPAYAILSHCWFSGDEELGFDGIQKGLTVPPRGFHKVVAACKIALQDGLEWIWIGNCCIDRRSEKAIQEAINSTYEWFANASVCYVYLEDVLVQRGVNAKSKHSEEFRASRWFRRCWTLQELLAPRDIIFYSHEWTLIGRLSDLIGDVTRATGIPEKVLSKEMPLSAVSIAERLQWAEGRSTTREEDVAYCLLGLVDVHMLAMYGEGREHAIKRLHEAIERRDELLIHDHAFDDGSTVDGGSVISDVSTAFSAATTLDGTIVSDELIQRFSNLLFNTRELKLLYQAALSDQSMGVARIRRNLRRMIATYGSNLKKEASTKDELGAARILQSRSMSARSAYSIVELAILAQEPGGGDLQDDPSDPVTSDQGQQGLREEDSSDEQSDTDEYGADDPTLVEESFVSLKKFLQRSAAYTHFQSRLLDFVHEPYEKRVLRALGDRLISPSAAKMGAPETLGLARELSWVPPRYISIKSEEPLGLANLIKARVEDIMGEEWQWWPLSPRQYTLRPGFRRLTWTTPCGRSDHVDFPQDMQNVIESTLASAPAFLNVPIGSSGNSTTMTSRSSHMFGSSNSPTGHDNSRISSQPTGVPTASPATNNANAAGQPINASTQNPRYVYLGVQTGHRYSISGIKVTESTPDLDFFSELKVEYVKARGILRTLFSIWRYDHCEFYEFRKHATGTGEPATISFPDDNNKDYDFRPRPLDSTRRPPLGPIGKIEFYDYFHHIQRSKDLTSRYWRFFTPRHLLNGLPNCSSVHLLPKKIHQLQLDDGNREAFWGLYAIEHRASAWLLMYGCLCNLPGIIFFFLWLFKWGHPADLQNASVPVQLSLSLTICFVALLYESREGRRV